MPPQLAKPIPTAPPSVGAAAGLDLAGEGFRTNWRGEPPAPPPGLAANPSAGTILQGLKRRWLLAAGLGPVLAVAAAAAAWYLLAPKFVATSEVLVRPIPPHLFSAHRILDAAEGQTEANAFRKQQALDIKSRVALTQALKDDGVKRIMLANPPPDPVLWLLDEIKVESGEGDIIHVSMTGSNPADLTTTVNAVVNAYRDEAHGKEEADRRTRRKNVEDVVTLENNALRDKHKEMESLADSLGTTESGALTQKQIGMLALLGDKKKEYAQTQYELRQTQAQLDDYLAQSKILQEVQMPASALSDALEVDEQVRQHRAMAERARLVMEHYEREAKYPEQESGWQKARNVYRRALRDIEARKSELAVKVREGMRQRRSGELDGTRLQLESNIKRLTKLEAALEKVVKEGEEATARFGRSSTELERLRTEISGDESRLGVYRSELAALKIEMQSPYRVEKHQEAIAQVLDSKKQMMGAMGAPVLALLGVCVAVGWWDSRARRIHSTGEVVSSLGMRLVGALPALPDGATALGDNEDARLHSLLESMDSLRTTLLREAGQSECRLVMVTSAGGGEGKTTVAGHLASSLARSGRRTLLVDGDLRSPALHQLFELPQQPGLSEVLLGEVHVAEATLATSLDGLLVIPAGEWDRDVVQALARDEVRRLFEKLKREYDFVVIDSHPVLAATDALLIGQHVDAVILSLLRGVSRTPQVYAAQQRLESLGIRVLGAVVNGVPEADLYNNAVPAPVAA
jgi:capsular exopolysaccharide synthesis family protein